MRIRQVVAGAVAAIGLAVLGVTTAGEAAAITPEFDPGSGIYGALDLDGAETAALHNSPIPRLLDGLWSRHGLIGLDPRSGIGRSASQTYGNFSDVVAEAAATGGTVSFGFVDPVRLYSGNIVPGTENRTLLVQQFLD